MQGVEEIVEEVQPDVIVTISSGNVEGIRCREESTTVLIVNREKETAYLFGAEMPTVEEKALKMPEGSFKTR